MLEQDSLALGRDYWALGRGCWVQEQQGQGRPELGQGWLVQQRPAQEQGWLAQEQRELEKAGWRRS